MAGSRGKDTFDISDANSENWRRESPPPLVIFQHPRRIWHLALRNAWEELQERRQVWRALPPAVMVPTPDRIEALLKTRWASFVVLSAKSPHYSATLRQLPDWNRRFPACTFTVTDLQSANYRPLLWELGVRCALQSPWQARELARWLAWHLKRFDDSPRTWLHEVWNRLPWAYWAKNSVLPQ